MQSVTRVLVRRASAIQMANHIGDLNLGGAHQTEQLGKHSRQMQGDRLITKRDADC